MTIPNPKNLFSIVHLTQKKSLISTVLYHYFRQKWRRYHKNVISALLGLCEKHWTVRHYHYELYPSRIFFRKFISFSLSDAEKFAEFYFYGTSIFEIWQKMPAISGWGDVLRVGGSRHLDPLKCYNSRENAARRIAHWQIRHSLVTVSVSKRSHWSLKYTPQFIVRKPVV